VVRLRALVGTGAVIGGDYGSNQGYSVALSPNTTTVVGSPRHRHVHLYIRPPEISPFYLPNRSGPCDNIFTRKRPSAAVR
jgi:hypothetical protein